MKKLLFPILFIYFSVLEAIALPVEAVIVEVKKSISLSKKDPVYRHFFINGGTNLGLAKGNLVNVIRRVPVHDPLLNKSIGDLTIKVGELEIIHSEAGISVGRVSFQESPEDRPLLEFEAIMVGDRIDLKTLKTAGDEIETKSETAVAKK